MKLIAGVTFLNIAYVFLTLKYVPPRQSDRSSKSCGIVLFLLPMVDCLLQRVRSWCLGFSQRLPAPWLGHD